MAGQKGSGAITFKSISRLYKTIKCDTVPRESFCSMLISPLNARALPIILSTCFALPFAGAQISGWDFEATAGLSHWFAAETDDGRAERERERFAFSAETATELGRGSRLGLSVGYVRDDDDWSGAYFNEVETPGEISPYDGVETFSVGLHYQQPVRGSWGVFARARAGWGVARFDGVRSSSERSWSDGFSGAFGAGASYRFSPALMVSFGAFYVDRLADDALIVPIIFVRWQINEHWMLNTANGIFLTHDVGADQRHLLTAGVSYESNDFAHAGGTIIDPDTGISESVKTYVEEKGFRVGLSYLVNLSPTWGIRTSLAYGFARDIELRANDRRLEKSDLDGSFVLGAAVTARF